MERNITSVLPVLDYKDKIIQTIKNNQVIIVKADTGAGKSTQIPQIILDMGYDVTVSQPRRIATRAISSKIAKEMSVKLGEIVGYRTAFESCDSNQTKLLFVTDGFLLKSFKRSLKNTKEVLTLDEVHEWNNNIEILVGLCKKAIKEGSKNKVVLMSATLEAEKLKEYFCGNAAVIDIPGRNYKVEKKHLYDTKISTLVRRFVKKEKNILVFLPGKREIESLISELEDTVDAVILPLHGELSVEEQNKCFETYEKPKVIIATNIAQTSLTIDVDVVIDSGKERIIKIQDGVEGLFLSEISQADIHQRAGRAGRIKDGEYILCSEFGIDERPEFSKPEIQRSILDQVVLRLADMEIDASTFDFFHQPNIEEIINAKESLKCLGALNEDGSISEIGRKMSKMPVSCKYARMIVEAEKRGVTDDVIVIAAIMEIGSLLSRDNKYYMYTNETRSDLLAELDIWNKFSGKYIDFKKEGINPKSYFRIKELIQKLFDSLKGIVGFGSSHDRKAILSSCISGMLDHVYFENFGDYQNGDGKTRSLDKNSCVKYSPEIVVGIPKTIEYKNNYGGDSIIDLVSMATEVESKLLFEIAPQLFTFEDSEPYYSGFSKSCMLLRYMYYKGREISNECIEVPDHPEANRLKEEWEAKQYNIRSNNSFNSYSERQKEIFVDGYRFKINYDWNGKNPTVYIPKNELLKLTTKVLKLDTGKSVKLSCEGRSSSDVLSLLKMLEHEKIAYELEKFKNSLPSEASAKKSVVTNWFANVGKVEITSKDIPNENGELEKIYRFVHLEVVDKKIKLNLSDDEEVANENTDEALRFLFGNEIKQNCNEKSFLSKKENKKTLTKKGEEAKKLFDELLIDTIGCLNIKNFNESLKEIFNIFNELTQGIN